MSKEEIEKISSFGAHLYSEGKIKRPVPKPLLEEVKFYKKPFKVKMKEEGK